jgi:hypothetical protein
VCVGGGWVGTVPVARGVGCGYALYGRAERCGDGGGTASGGDGGSSTTEVTRLHRRIAVAGCCT